MSRKLSVLFGLGLLLAATQASAIVPLTRVGSVAVPMYSGQAVTFAAPYAYVVSPQGLHVPTRSAALG